MLPRIMQGGQSSQSHEQSAYRVALVSLIKSMPQTAYMHEMPSLMPLLIRGLDLPDAEIRASVIDTFISAVGNDSAEHSGIYEYASTLVSTMLKNSIASEMSSTRVRIAALRYLGILPNIVRYDVLHPYKPTVIRELAKVLDDPKRSVRKEAVDARTSWFKYNG
jgi:DNA repair/transcription protein MET18/MMS19